MSSLSLQYFFSLDFSLSEKNKALIHQRTASELSFLSEQVPTVLLNLLLVEGLHRGIIWSSAV